MSKVVWHWTLELVLKLLSGPRGENHGCLEMRSLKTCGIRLGMPSITFASNANGSGFGRGQRAISDDAVLVLQGSEGADFVRRS